MSLGCLRSLAPLGGSKSLTSLDARSPHSQWSGRREETINGSGLCPQGARKDIAGIGTCSALLCVCERDWQKVNTTILFYELLSHIETYLSGQAFYASLVENISLEESLSFNKSLGRGGLPRWSSSTTSPHSQR